MKLYSILLKFKDHVEFSNEEEGCGEFFFSEADALQIAENLENYHAENLDFVSADVMLLEDVIKAVENYETDKALKNDPKR